jgi:hypothetical protein
LFESAPLLQALTALKSVPAGTIDNASIRAKLIAVIPGCCQAACPRDLRKRDAAGSDQVDSSEKEA